MATRAELKALAEQAGEDALKAVQAATAATAGDKYTKNAELYPADSVLAVMYSEIVEKLNAFELTASAATDDASKILGLARKYEEADGGYVGGGDLSNTANAVYLSISGMVGDARGALKRMTADPSIYAADNEAAIAAAATVVPQALYLMAGDASDISQASAEAYATAAALKAIELGGE